MRESQVDYGTVGWPGLGVIVGLCLAFSPLLGCEGSAAPSAEEPRVKAAPLAAAADATDTSADSAAPEGGECATDQDCASGTWCGNGYCRECDLDIDCEDDAACTDDRCGAEGRCTHAAIEGCCTSDSTPQQLAEACGAPPLGVEPEDFWECTVSGECVVRATVSPLIVAPMEVATGAEAAGAKAAAGSEALDVPDAPYQLPAPMEGSFADSGLFEVLACSGCLNPGGMNKRINGSKCTSDALCLSGSCQGGFCAPWRAVGDSCDWMDECTSSNCVNGYCCSSVCDGTCDHCGLSGQEGTCGNGCRIETWRSEVQTGAVYESDAGQDIVLLANFGFHPGGRTVPGGSDTHIMDWGIINADYGPCMAGPTTELCDNMDNDCDSFVDEDWTSGPGAKLGEPCTVGTGPCTASGYWVCPEGGLGLEPECSAEEYASGIETCNNIDDDCDGDTDETLKQACTALCGQGQEECVAGVWQACNGPVPGDFPNYGQPCDGPDSDECPNGVYGCNPGQGFHCNESPVGGIVEDCNTVLDDDCNGSTNDPGADNCRDFWVDVDGDGFGVGTPQCLCEATIDYRALEDGDCDDGDGTVYPGAPEPCNGIDNDCDGIGDDLEPNGVAGEPSYSGGSTNPGHPCLGVNVGVDCDVSGCFCTESANGTDWICFTE